MSEKLWLVSVVTSYKCEHYTFDNFDAAEMKYKAKKKAMGKYDKIYLSLVNAVAKMGIVEKVF